MNTPIYDFVKKYVSSQTVRAHMPGHKGRDVTGSPFSDAYLYDITEIDGADALFEASGIIRESERNASSLFGTAETVYSSFGSTSCIYAMLASACRPHDTVIAARNAHRAFVNACTLLDLDVVWVYPRFSGTIISGEISLCDVENALAAHHASAVYVTSPDYLGKTADIRSISEICRSHGAYLLCDNAHGAYLAFLHENIHPTVLGADMCCDSAHKTLPVLTGGAYLHSMNAALAGRAKENMSLFCSSSPSYLIMQSLDLCNGYLAGKFPDDLAEAVDNISELKALLSQRYTLCGDEPLKISLCTADAGYTGTDTAAYLRENGIECEYADDTHTVLMLSVCNTAEETAYIGDVLMRLPQREPLSCSDNSGISPMEQVMSIREASFAANEFIPREELERAAGRICGRAVTCCPPGIAAAVPGERITEENVKFLKRYGIPGINVVK